MLEFVVWEAFNENFTLTNGNILRRIRRGENELKSEAKNEVNSKRGRRRGG
jgi:hypothetical protein